MSSNFNRATKPCFLYFSPKTFYFFLLLSIYIAKAKIEKEKKREEKRKTKKKGEFIMAEEQNGKKYETIEDMLNKGAILYEYGSKTFISVYPYPMIHKVKISIVDLNTSGKNFLDYYMDMEKFRLLCDDIDSKRMAAKLAKDEGPYPKAYEYVTGTNGSKKLNIGNGKKGVLIQLQEYKNNNWVHKYCVVSVDALKTMSFLFKLVMGLTPVTQGTYYYGLIKMFYKGVEKTNAMHRTT